MQYCISEHNKITNYFGGHGYSSMSKCESMKFIDETLEGKLWGLGFED